MASKNVTVQRFSNVFFVKKNFFTMKTFEYQSK